MLMKKCFTLILILIAASQISFAQLAAHAGTDAVWCYPATLSSPPLGPHLGGQPSATGGTPPYTYSWSTYDGLYPFQYLDSDSVANPQMVSWAWGIHYVDFELVVKDANGQTARDTVRTYTSTFTHVLYKCVVAKLAGDTATLVPGITGGTDAYAPIKYKWTPAQYLSSDTAMFPLCWSPVDKYYMVHATDSVGCTDTPLEGPCYVVVVSGNVQNKQAPELKIYPNPTSDRLFVGGDHEDISAVSVIIVYDIAGRKIGVQRTNSYGIIELNTATLASGTYMLEYQLQGRRYSHLFVKE